MAPSRTASIALVAAAVISGAHAQEDNMMTMLTSEGQQPDLTALMGDLPEQCKDYSDTVVAMMGTMDQSGVSAEAEQAVQAEVMKAFGASEQCEPFLSAIVSDMGGDDDDGHDDHDHEGDDDGPDLSCMFDLANFPAEGSEDYPSAEMIKSLCDCGEAGVDKLTKQVLMSGTCMGAMVGQMMGGMMSGLGAAMGDAMGEVDEETMKAQQAQMDAAMEEMKKELEKTITQAHTVSESCSSKALIEKLCGDQVEEAKAKVEDAVEDVKEDKESSASRASLFMSAMGALAWIMA